MDSWRRVWREGFAPVLPIRGLLALRTALINDDPRLIQGTTTHPAPLLSLQDYPIEAACGLGLCGWLGESRETVGEVEESFARYCFEADQRLGEPAACRWFLNWFDDTPRDLMRRELLAEVEHTIKGHIEEILNQPELRLPRGMIVTLPVGWTAVELPREHVG